MHTSIEAVNAYDDLSHDWFSQSADWFGWSARHGTKAYYQAIPGIWEEPGGLAYVFANQDQDIHLSNLPYRGGHWKIDISGTGRYVDRFEVDGQLIPGVAKVPEKYLTAAYHWLTPSTEPTSPPVPCCWIRWGYV